MSQKVTVDTFTRMFQYEIINVFYLNKIFVFWKVTTPLYPFWKSKDKTPIYLFFDCLGTQNLWRQLCCLPLSGSLCINKLIIPALILQSVIFGFLESNHKSEMLINHILLIFKVYIYNSRDSILWFSVNCKIEIFKSWGKSSTLAPKDIILIWLTKYITFL